METAKQFQSTPQDRIVKQGEFTNRVKSRQKHRLSCVSPLFRGKKKIRADQELTEKKKKTHQTHAIREVKRLMTLLKYSCHKRWAYMTYLG